MRRLVGHISRVYPAKSTNIYEDDPMPIHTRKKEDTAMTQITVNGSHFGVKVEFLSYADIATLAGKPDQNNLTITYWKGRRCGTLRPGRSIDAEDGMNFTAVHTGAA